MPDQSGPPTLTLALSCVVVATMAACTRPALLRVVRPADGEFPDAAGTRIVVPFPNPRRPLDDGPDDAA